MWEAGYGKLGNFLQSAGKNLNGTTRNKLFLQMMLQSSLVLVNYMFLEYVGGHQIEHEMKMAMKLELLKLDIETYFFNDDSFSICWLWLYCKNKFFESS